MARRIRGPSRAAAALTLLVLGAAAVPQGAPRAPRIEEGRAIVSEAIEPIELEAHVAYLAEHCEGRASGTAGERRAAEYLAARLAEAGIEPAGDLAADGERSYFQDIGLVRRSLAAPVRVALRTADGRRIELTDGADFAVERLARVAGEFVTLRRDVLDDAVAAGGAVLTTESTGRALRWLRDRGDKAPDVLLVAGPVGAQRARPPRLERGGPSGALVLRISRDAAQHFSHDGAVRIDVRADVDEEKVPSANVVGIVRGSGAEAGAIVLSAHYDHLGTREPREGEPEDADRTFDGADDDASGVAAVLEIAEAIALGPRPQRDVVVLLATAEEIGLLGTLHYLDHPVVPLERTVANVNFEMIGRPDPLLGTGLLWLTGAERTNLLETARGAGFPLSADPRPDQDFFRRSDNFAFARIGIVAQTLSSYGMHTDYHTVGDSWWKLDYEHMAASLVPALGLVRLLADGAMTPEWLPGGRP